MQFISCLKDNPSAAARSESLRTECRCTAVGVRSDEHTHTHTHTRSLTPFVTVCGYGVLREGGEQKGGAGEGRRGRAGCF